MCQLEHNMKNELSKQYVFDEVVVPCGYITKSSFFCWMKKSVYENIYIL